jgi:hypothetical protein
MIVQLKTDLASVAADLGLEQRNIRVAAQRALNVAAKGRRTDASRALRERYPTLKAKDASAAFDVHLASPENLQAVITVRGRPLNLARFASGEVTKGSRRRGGGVWVNIKGQRKFIDGAWIKRGTNKSGDDYATLFVREKGAKRMPIRALTTIDLPNAVNIKELAEILDQQTGTRFDNEFLRQLDRELARQSRLNQ